MTTLGVLSAKTLERLDQWNTYCVLVMPDHIHLLTAPLERELSVAATAPVNRPISLRVVATALWTVQIFVE